jgi:hypothetical protein
MKNQVGYQVGLKSMMPMNEAAILHLVKLSMGWQELKGPCIIFVDEPFYDFLVRAGLEEIYQDVIPIPEELDTVESVIEYANTIFPEAVFYVEECLNSEELPSQENLFTSLPDKVQNGWRQLVDNELIIFSMHNLEKN